ncbi:hypothetical protein CS542_04215 [Pedobacter sp. IW39]|nr:hypothetical protein CS542_04215 [Pedobacter sp. IW39]
MKLRLFLLGYIDGLPGGTIEPMSAGLIPIVSKFWLCTRKFIFEMEDLSVQGLNAAIDRVLALSDTTYAAYSALRIMCYRFLCSKR